MYTKKEGRDSKRSLNTHISTGPQYSHHDNFRIKDIKKSIISFKPRMQSSFAIHLGERELREVVHAILITQLSFLELRKKLNCNKPNQMRVSTNWISNTSLQWGLTNIKWFPVQVPYVLSSQILNIKWFSTKSTCLLPNLDM